MKKLILTTALTGLMISGNAIAQTAITGELRIAHKAVSSSAPTAGTTTSNRGFGIEQQLNISNKGKLNVGGLSYAAGFSLENDGVQSSTLFNENNYIDIINAASGTTISFSQDHIQRMDTSRSNSYHFGFDANDMSTSGVGTTMFSQTGGPGVGQSQAVAIIQDVGTFGKFSYAYAPTLTDSAGSATVTGTTGAGSDAGLDESNEESAYEIGFVGDLGVKGLNVAYFKSEQKAKPTQPVKSEGQYLGASYTTGAITAGVTRREYFNDEVLASAKKEIKETHYGLTYAVDKDISVNAVYGKVDASDKAARPNDQKIKMIQVGYNLGPVALVAAFAKNEDIGGVAGQDSDVFMTRLLTAF
jgi:hypothetical protein